MIANKKRCNSSLASLQHLCSLGLPSETVMPDLLKGVNEWMAADGGQFIWVDAAQNPCGFLCDTGHATFWKRFSAEVDRLSISGQTLRNGYLFRKTAWAVGGPEDVSGYYHSSFYSEVMRHCGGECSMAIPVHDLSGVPRAQIGLNRNHRSHPFTSLECRQYEQFAAHLSLLFPASPEVAAAMPQRAGERGMAVFDNHGRLLHADDTARELLFLAGHPKLARIGGIRESADVESRLRGICGDLHRIANGVPAAPPTFTLATPWGRLLFRAHQLSSFATDRGKVVGMDIVRYIPRRLAIWRQVRTLDLSPRLRQVCLEFAENRSLSEIADLFGISRHTVIDHVNKIYERYGLDPGRENLQEYLHGRGEQYM